MRIVAVLLILLPGPGCAQLDRAAHDFNLVLARDVLRPMSESYQRHVPEPIRIALLNITENIEYTETLANNILQAKFHKVHTDWQRILLNTTVGWGGIFDVATEVGLPRYEEDFGQTLAVWGFPEGHYLNIPFLGPSTTRDMWQYPAAFAMSPFTYVDATAISLPESVLAYLFERFDQVEDLDAVEEAADPYAFIKDAYLQRRRFLVHDGHPPDTVDDEAIDEVLDEDLEDLEDLDESDPPTAPKKGAK